MKNIAYACKVTILLWYVVSHYEQFVTSLSYLNDLGMKPEICYLNSYK